MISEMKNLGFSDRLNKYELIKIDILSRVKNAYKNCTDKNEFYKDVFEILGVYEGDILLNNLFLEENCVEIINSLKKNQFFSVQNINISSKDSISSEFREFIFSKSEFSEFDLIQFLKNKSIKITNTSISINDWKNENTNSNPIINNFCSFFTNSEITIENKIFGYFLFVKIWNQFDDYINPFNNSKGIVMYRNLNYYLENNDFEIFYNFFQTVLKTSNSLFVKYKYQPIIDNEENDSYRSGYLKQREDFNKYLDSFKKRKFLNDKMSYHQLSEVLKSSEDVLLSNDCQKLIIQKIKNFEYPDNNELNTLINLENEKFKLQICKMLYLFSTME